VNGQLHAPAALPPRKNFKITGEKIVGKYMDRSHNIPVFA
jgi:hypothetical protein